MLVLNVNSGSTATSTPISCSKTLNTNSNLIFNDSLSTVKIVQPGIYEVSGIATVTSTASGNFGVGVYADGILQGVATYGTAAESGELITLSVYSVLNVDSTDESVYVTVSLLPVGQPIIAGGTVSVKKVS